MITLIIFQPTKNPQPRSRGNAVTLISGNARFEPRPRPWISKPMIFVILLWPSRYISGLKLDYDKPHLVQFIIYLSSCLLTYLFTYLLTYLLTHSHTHIPWSRILLEKPTGCQVVKKYSAFYGSRRFITAFTRVRHLSLS